MTLGDIQKLQEDYARNLKAKVEEVHGPYWKSRADLAKLLISLSSAILATTITFSEMLLKGLPGASCPILVVVSWSLLLLSLLLGVACVWFDGIFMTFHPRFLNMGSELDDRFKMIDLKSSDAPTKVTNALKEISDNALAPIARADRWAFRALIAALVSFAAALGALIVFGSTQVL